MLRSPAVPEMLLERLDPTLVYCIALAALCDQQKTLPLESLSCMLAWSS